MTKIDIHRASFRDRDSTVFHDGDSIKRLIYNSYREDYDLLMSSGLYDVLTNSGRLIMHQEVTNDSINSFENVYKIIKPQNLPFISYPYEWSFAQLKDAALLTLNVQLKALECGMSLKDATAFNIQFLNSKPIFIDTASFEKYNNGEPWFAYKQFCQHFIAPLLCYKYNLPALIKLTWANIDGLPLGVVSKSLPFSSKFSFFNFTHIHYHSKLEEKYNSDSSLKNRKIYFSQKRLIAFLKHLKQGIADIQLPKTQTEWSNYYETFSYNSNSFSSKREIIEGFLLSAKAKNVLDLGCNEGEFSLLAAEKCQSVISADFDFLVIEKLYKKLKKNKFANILPLVLDLVNPTPSIGWANTERDSFFQRINSDTTMALALIHHLSIGNNVPFSKCAELFSSFSENLIIEFVPKTDSQTQKLLITKKDVFLDYNLENFKQSFSVYFQIISEKQISGSDRILFLMKRYA